MEGYAWVDRAAADDSYATTLRKKLLAALPGEEAADVEYEFAEGENVGVELECTCGRKGTNVRVVNVADEQDPEWLRECDGCAPITS